MDLTRGFAGSGNRQLLFSDLTEAFENADPTAVVLALEGLTRMEIINKFEWSRNDKKKCNDIVQMWRNGFLMHVNNRGILQNLTILEVFKIAIDDPGNATTYTGNANLLKVFDSWTSCRDEFINNLTQALDPAVAVLALEGLHRMDERPFINEDDRRNEPFRNLLRTWRNTAPLNESYTGRKSNKKLKVYLSVPDFLRSLTIFRTLGVPMFIDDYGGKDPPCRFSGEMEPIAINGSTPIAHVTHSKQAAQIVEDGRLKPSNNKNTLEGCWFGFESSNSVYGNKSFGMTLDRLGVRGLRQGEIVSYKREINVILYATNDGIANFEGLVQPSRASAQRHKDKPAAYVHVSIFVSPELLGDEHCFEVNEAPDDITHGGMCVMAKRERRECNELDKPK